MLGTGGGRGHKTTKKPRKVRWTGNEYRERRANSNYRGRPH